MSYEEELEYLFPLLITTLGLSGITEHWSIIPVKGFDIHAFKDHDNYSIEPYDAPYIKYRFFEKNSHEIVAYFRL